MVSGHLEQCLAESVVSDLPSSGSFLLLGSTCAQGNEKLSVAPVPPITRLGWSAFWCRAYAKEAFSQQARHHRPAAAPQSNSEGAEGGDGDGGMTERSKFGRLKKVRSCHHIHQNILPPRFGGRLALHLLTVVDSSC